MSSAVQTMRKVRPNGPVRVTLPATVAYEPDALKETIGALQDRIGDRAWSSRSLSRFPADREYIIQQTAATPAVGIAGPSSIQSLFPAMESPARHVHYDIDKVVQAVDHVVQALGPCQCHSGFDVLYQNEIRVIRASEKPQPPRSED
jgi:hypothetical protein